MVARIRNGGALDSYDRIYEGHIKTIIIPYTPFNRNTEFNLMPPKKAKASSQSYEQPTLTVSMEDADKAIGERLQKGEEILSQKISNEQELEELSNEIDRWIDFNGQLIAKLFSNPSEKESYDSKRQVFGAVSYLGGAIRSAFPDTHNQVFPHWQGLGAAPSRFSYDGYGTSSHRKGWPYPRVKQGIVQVLCV